MPALTEKRSPGRPREFDRDTALRAAMLVFWRQGYEGASLADLTDAMEISKPTLYAAFGDKEGLLREALRMYLGPDNWNKGSNERSWKEIFQVHGSPVLWHSTFRASFRAGSAIRWRGFFRGA